MLNDADIEYIIKNNQKIILGKREVRSLLEKVPLALEGNTSQYFTDLDYYIYIHNNKKFLKSLLQLLFEVYGLLALKADNPKMKEKLSRFLHRSIEHIIKHLYSKVDTLEKRVSIMENMLQHMTSNLSKKLDTQQLMMANISHEMRTYLNAILGYNTSAKECPDINVKVKSFLTISIKATRSLQNLIDDILDLSKINAGQLEIKKEWFWLGEAILHAINQVESSALKKGLLFKVERVFFPLKFYGDSHRITQVLVNLLSNAIKFTESGIVSLLIEKVSLCKDEAEIHFVVKDSGIGMTEEARSMIFDPYSRFAKEKQGVGLGMHISYSLVHAMRGSLTLQSTLGEGSEFTFTIKMQQDKQSAIDLKDNLICLYNDTDKITNLADRVSFLSERNADVRECYDEETFLKNIFDVNTKAPNMLFVTSKKEGHERMNALVFYLKKSSRYKNTLFVAEETAGTNEPLDAFDYVYEHFPPMSIYTKQKSTIKYNQGCSLSRVRILAIDDIETNLDVLKLFLESKFPEIKLDLASGGYEAIGMYKINHYDLILMDLKMPGLDGFEVYKKLQAIRVPRKIYALTADVYKDTVQKVMDSGFNGLLEKPLQPKMLFDTITPSLPPNLNPHLI